MKMFTMLMALMFSIVAFADSHKTYTLGYSHYPSWENMVFEDIVKKHADKHGVKIKVVLVNDYVESMNLLVAGNNKPSGSGSIDMVTATNIDGLTLLAVSASSKNPVEAFIVNSYSNGNDKILSKVAKTVKELKGKEVKIVEFSVSHYMLARALSMNGMKETDLAKLINTSDADMQAVVSAEPKSSAVTWNPAAQNLAERKDINVVFDSKQVPQEILDLTFARGDVPDKVKQAVADAWQEMVNNLQPSSSKRKATVERLAKESGSSVEVFEKQLSTTGMFSSSKDAAAVFASPKLKETMQYVRDFSHEKGLLGNGPRDAMGIQFPDGSVLGNAKNVKMKFTTKYMEAAANVK